MTNPLFVHVNVAGGCVSFVCLATPVADLTGLVTVVLECSGIRCVKRQVQQSSTRWSVFEFHHCGAGCANFTYINKTVFAAWLAVHIAVGELSCLRSPSTKLSSRRVERGITLFPVAGRLLLFAISVV